MCLASVNSAIAHYYAGRPREAEKLCRDILAGDHTCVHAWHLLGLIYLSDGQNDLATNHLKRALALAPYNAEVHNHLGMAAANRGEVNAALGYFLEAIAVRPDLAEAHYNVGVVRQAQGNLDDANVRFRLVLEIEPGYVDAWRSLGDVYLSQGRPSDAAGCFQRLVELQPDCAAAHVKLGHAYFDLGRFSDAEACYSRAVVLDPSCGASHYNLGAALKDQGRLQAAEDCFRQALRLNSELVEARFNLGYVLMGQRKLDEARQILDEVIAVEPSYADAHFNRAVIMLLQGKYDEGWSEMEWRWHTSMLERREFHRPEWAGQNLEGKMILLHAEQGLGDTFQFIRYVPIVKRLGGVVVVECQKSLQELVSSCSGIDQLIGAGGCLPDFDFYLPLLSLPRVLKTQLHTIPSQVPYLFAKPSLVAQWREHLASVRGFRIGINWQGRAGQGAYRLRDVPLDLFASLAEVSGESRLISLQKGQGRQELIEANDRFPIIDLGEELDTRYGAFMDTAAVMMNLDLVITSDTSIAHLAGSLGVPVWTVLPFAADWRWLLDRIDSPWYPTMRLFRQTHAGDGVSVFQEIQNVLRAKVSRWRTNSL